MGDLVWLIPRDGDSGSVADLEPPPDDPLAGQAWLAKTIRREIHDVATDRSLASKDRRDELIRLAKAHTAVMPDEMRAAAKRVVEDDRAELADKGLGGTVKAAKRGGPAPIRASGPRGRRSRGKR